MSDKRVEIDPSRELSLMDHQIRSIDEIRVNSNLLRLNLHSNQIQRISSLTSLNYLTELDLSSNKISRIQGLEGLLSLKRLNLSSNRLIMVEGLFPLKNLFHLNLSYNRIERLKGFQDLWGDEFHLRELFLHGNQIDSFDEVSLNLRGLTRLEHLTLKENPVSNENHYRPSVFNRLKTLRTLDQLDRQMNSSSIEHQIDSTTATNNRIQRNNREISDQSLIDDFPKIERVLGQLFDESNKQDKSIDRIEVDNEFVSHSASGNSSIEQIYRQTVNELNSEKDRRWRLEQNVEQLERELERMKQQDKRDKSNQSIVNELNDNFQRRIDDEKRKFNELTRIVDDYQEKLKASDDQLHSYRKAQENNSRTISKLESEFSELQSENNRLKSDLNEARRKCEQDFSLLQQENLCLRENNEQLKKQLELCRQLYTDREIQIKESQDQQRSIVQTEHIQRVVDNEKSQLTELFNNQMKHHEEKFSNLSAEYKKLENEFRDALKIEERRYQQLFKSNEILQKENEILQSNSNQIKEKDQSNRKMLDELINLVKEQKAKIKEKNKSNQELVEQNKQVNGKLERTLHELKKIREQILLLEQERKQFESRHLAQQSILAALREEKQHWSQELAHQGASLAQDRGRLESTIELLHAEQKTLRKQIDKELDNNKIKQTIIDNQLDTIQKLKDGIVERDETIKQIRQETIELRKEFERQVEDEQNAFRELNDKYEKVSLKRDSLKDELVRVQQELIHTREEHNVLVNKWKEKSDLINDLDNKIRRAADNYQINEKKLVEENQRLVQRDKEMNEKLRQRDDDFRRQFETIEHSHRVKLNQIQVQYQQKIDQAEQRVKQVEDEMRIILLETNDKQKKFQEKIKHFSSLITELQQNNSNL